MIQRLRMLKNYLGILVEEGVLDPDTNLSDEEWQMLEEIEKLLEPFYGNSTFIGRSKICHIKLSALSHRGSQRESCHRY